MQVKDLIGAVNGAGRAASEIRRMWKEEAENGMTTATVDTELLEDWYKKITRLVMLVQGIEIGCDITPE